MRRVLQCLGWDGRIVREREIERYGDGTWATEVYAVKNDSIMRHKVSSLSGSFSLNSKTSAEVWRSLRESKKGLTYWATSAPLAVKKMSPIEEIEEDFNSLQDSTGSKETIE
jgi:hypothetical protein